MVGYDILRNNRLVSSNRDKDLETGHYHHEYRRRRHSSELLRSTVQLLQEQEELLNKKILEYEKLRYENFNKEEEIKLEINYLDDFIEKLKSFIRQEEDIENTLALMNVLIYSPDQPSPAAAQDVKTKLQLN